MANRERTKGREGERQVARIFRQLPTATIQNLEGQGDLTVMLRRHTLADIPHLHVEVKRCETARPWAWFEQASREAPAGAVPVVAFRRSRSPWLALIALDDLVRLLA